MQNRDLTPPELPRADISLHISWVGPFLLPFSLLAKVKFVKSNLYFLLRRAFALDSGPLASAFPFSSRGMARHAVVSRTKNRSPIDPLSNATP